MKKLAILTVATLLVAGAVGCQNWQGCGLFRGRPLAAEPAVICDPCVPACDPCAPACVPSCNPCTGAPVTITPGPETYAPVTQ